MRLVPTWSLASTSQGNFDSSAALTGPRPASGGPPRPHLALAGEDDTGGERVEQRRAGRLLELAGAAGERRLAYVEGVRRGRDVAAVDDREEMTQETRMHDTTCGPRAWAGGHRFW